MVRTLIMGNRKKINPQDTYSDDDDDTNSTKQLVTDDEKKLEPYMLTQRVNADKEAKMKVKENKKHPFAMVTNVKEKASKWKEYTSSRRFISLAGRDKIDRKDTFGEGLANDGMPNLNDSCDSLDLKGNTGNRIHSVSSLNRQLLKYFEDRAKPKRENDNINFDDLNLLLENGAKINCTDKYGQSVLHEAARLWHPHVTKFLLENGSKINQGDVFGRTPLHIAAGTNYPEMVEFLIESGANKECVTKGEQQTPVFYAAKMDAVDALGVLIDHKCEYKIIRDWKGRTPLHVAAELDRSVTAEYLVELDDPAPAGVIDIHGESAISSMISKMCPVAMKALDNLHIKDRANRTQLFYLNHLEPKNPDNDLKSFPKSPLRVAVANSRFDILIHPLFQKLIMKKWHQFGRRGVIKSTCLNVIFILLWTVQAVAVDNTERREYKLPNAWWRIVILVLAIIFTVYQIFEEISEFVGSRRRHAKWKEWKEMEIDKDIEFTHPQWPLEKKYLEQEKDILDDCKPAYANDFWNIFDWVVYLMLTVVIVTHIIDILHKNEASANAHLSVFSFTIILVWIRIMKSARAFSSLGPFIVILTHMKDDVAKFSFMYMVFYIPFVCGFWMIFGGQEHIDGMGNFTDMLFTLFRMTLVDEYPYDDMKEYNKVMAILLTVAWLSISAVVMLNLLIALMSETFTRVQDNAKENALMQKAMTILNVEDSLSYEKKRKYWKEMSEGPLEDAYDDDNTAEEDTELKKMTFKINDSLKELNDRLDDNLDQIKRDNTIHYYDEDKQSYKEEDPYSLDDVINEVNDLKDDLENFQNVQQQQNIKLYMELLSIKTMIQSFVSNSGNSTNSLVMATLPSPFNNPAFDDNESVASSERKPSRGLRRDWEITDRKKKKKIRKLRKALSQTQKDEQ